MLHHEIIFLQQLTFESLYWNSMTLMFSFGCGHVPYLSSEQEHVYYNKQYDLQNLRLYLEIDITIH